MERVVLGLLSGPCYGNMQFSHSLVWGTCCSYGIVVEESGGKTGEKSRVEQGLFVCLFDIGV